MEGIRNRENGARAKPNMKLKDRVAIITGSGSGIGRSIALEFGRQGACVVIAEMKREAGTEVERELRKAGTTAMFVQVDLEQTQQIQCLMDTIMARFSRLDVLVNNAGVNFVKPTLQVTEADWEHVLSVDLRGTFFASQEALRVMVAQRSGCIVNIGSVHSTATLSGAAPYAAAKAAVVQLTRALAIEFGEFGIRVNSVSPGAIETQIWKDAEATAPDRVDFHRHWLRHIPSRRVGRPEEIAKLVAFLASDEASYVTGANLVADGGMTSMLIGSQDWNPK
jgi:NAD(P)-dependent dehydrogenase (short-subunit alcohol dehydrogenase family)